MRCGNTENMLNNQLTTFFGLILIVAASDVISGSSCPQDYTLLSSENVCYRFSGVARSRSDAEQDCSSTSGGHLATIDGTSETVEDLVDLAWITMDYVTELPANYVWVKQQEDECQVLSSDDNWSVIPYDCEALLPYICQTDVPGALDNFYEVDFERFDSSEDSSSNVRLRRATRKRLRKCTASRKVCRRIMALRRARIARLRARIARRRARKGRKPADACSASRQPLHETDRSGTIVSPKYPNTYPKNSYCQWLIESQGANGIIQLIVTSFTTIENSDNLYIYDGHNDSATLMVTMTGHYIETMQFYSSGRYMFIRFEATSNSSVDEYGFSATYISIGCNGGGFLCSSTRQCLTECHVCDGVNDCGDNSDESDCSTYTVCPVDGYRCSGNGVCIPPCQRCNGRLNCPYGDDEDNCTSSRYCEPDQFKCNNGYQCISSCGKCDGYSDCNDGSDEYNCPCPPSQFRCNDYDSCVSSSYLCDGSCYCGIDCSDEFSNCSTDFEAACSPQQRPKVLQTPTGDISLPSFPTGLFYGLCQWLIAAAADDEIVEFAFTSLNSSFTYSGVATLKDGSTDESAVIATFDLDAAVGSEDKFYSSQRYMLVQFSAYYIVSTPGFTATYASLRSTIACDPSHNYFECLSNGSCIPGSDYCNGECQCSDCSDEPVNCTARCRGYETLCSSGACVTKNSLCNGRCDCFDCTDEFNCNCTSTQYQCPSTGQCINNRCARCNGYCECKDCSDEANCTCGADKFKCRSTGRCISLAYSYCDGYCDCGDCSDEPANCTRDCGPTKFMCNMGDCIYLDSYCDGDCDCSDCSDEPSTCHDACLSSQFECSSSGKCLPSYVRCNAGCECNDCSDERNCSYTCTSDQFKCSEYGSCKPNCLQCDGWCDCLNCTDEFNCECASDQFECISNGRCIKSYTRCDGSCDCNDCSDEINCTCSSDQFQCASTGRCIPLTYRCDRVAQCANGEDEADCVGVCGSRGYHCDDGWCLSTRAQCEQTYCRPNQFLCDGYEDCPDNSDELNCTTNYTTPSPFTTTPMTGLSSNCSGLGDYQCDDGLCVHLVTSCTSTWCRFKRDWNFRCDGYQDCPDNSDELNCPGIATSTCGPGQFACTGDVSTGFSCIPQIRWCNGNPDCSDGSDEIDCPCLYSYQFQCANRQCIYTWQKCDGYVDCDDGSDEIDCKCPANRFRCNNGQCVNVYSYCQGYSYCSDHSDQSNCTCGDQEFQCASTYKCIRQCKVCDGKRDCVDGSDETNCTCDATTQFECQSGGCIPICKRCDMGFDCADRSDEYNCPSRCPATNQFQCAYGGRCVSSCSRCDGRFDCYDGSDEFNCTGWTGTPSGTVPWGWTGSSGWNQQTSTSWPGSPGGTGSSGWIGSSGWNQQTSTSWPGSPGGTGSSGWIGSSGWNQQTSTTFGPCDPGSFRCSYSGECIPSYWLCDGSCDCSNCSDEYGCNCTDNQIRCPSGRCLWSYRKCDSYCDCEDCSDERNCSCQFRCNNTRCYSSYERCDGVNNCGDYTDEIGCYCYSYNQFRCSNGLCLGISADCDGVRDCFDGSDERPNCAQGCRSNEFNCTNGRCVSTYSRCNGVNDCGDFSDEIDCYCYDGKFRCQMGICVSEDTWCDGYTDCPDSSDEILGCAGTCPTNSTGSRICEPLGKCIFSYKVCDGKQDCPDDSDEVNCTCRYGLFGCLNGRCIHEQFLCDGVKDCPLGDDESPSLCHHCGATEFQCVRATNTCISVDQRCDGVPQCPDLSDESNCFAVNSSTKLLIVNYNGDAGYYVCGDSSWPTAFSDVICRELGHVSSTLTEVVNISSSGNTNWLSLSTNADTSSPVLLSLQQSTCATNLAVAIHCSDYQCGRRSANISNVGVYIIGGQWALRGAWPWQVMLKVDGVFYCGGSLINDRWILTAAHCTLQYGLQLRPSQYSIRLGSVLATGSDADLVVSAVDKVITYPTFNSATPINDVGLLRLEQPVVFTDTIRPICLPTMDVNLKKFKVCVDTGFGRTSTYGSLAERLLQIRMNILSASDCNEVLNVLFRNSFDLSIFNDTVICLGQEPFEGDGICSGDSGGPLACQDHQGTWSVIGVNSFVGPYGCYQGVAARLPTYVDWIQQTIADNS